jgi:hypothetical protein
LIDWCSTTTLIGILYPSQAPGFTPDLWYYGSVFINVLVFCVVFLWFVCIPPVSWISNITSVSGLSILDCPFGFFWRLLVQYPYIYMLYYNVLLYVRYSINNIINWQPHIWSFLYRFKISHSEVYISPQNPQNLAQFCLAQLV